MPLIDQSDPARSGYAGPDWHREVLDDLARSLTPPSDFPCTFSQNAFRRELIQLIFVEDTGSDARARLRADLSAYIAQARQWNGQVNTARPLVVAFSHDAVPPTDLAGYHEFGWRMLQDWHDNDPAPWPEDVARDPEEAFWSMCFDGMQLFVNMSAPAHVKRRSRNLGQHFLFIVNPRERFDVVAGETPDGARVRGVIRSRAEAYDGMPHAPVLGKFLKGELEWPQYALPDDNQTFPETCPLHTRAG
ncbi:YqcI/YcgG family protein [Marimonas arenosa]|uniref:YqcI/YcgG family protein n=1 Tax=Marimonas arenosa TaxID=1795305 RepID=A0AAE3WDX7_9RHOB|nr:YqcI/YcgG family protein [Marimonas arenosa]MDQ2090894.1 YqcI/YcgG family protein [Marimonas arenosa]